MQRCKAKTRSRFWVLIISIISEADNSWGVGGRRFFASFFLKKKKFLGGRCLVSSKNKKLFK